MIYENLIFYAGSFIILNLAMMRTHRYGGSGGAIVNFIGANSEDVIALALVTFPFWLPFLIISLKRLLTAKIPREIVVDPDAGLLTIRYSKKKADVIPFDILACSHAPNGSRWHISVTFNKKFIGTRGQWVYKKVISVIGFRYTMSWTIAQPGEITAFLHECGVESRKKSDEPMTIVDKIIG